MSSPRVKMIRPAYRAGLSILTAVDTMAWRVGSSSALFTCSARARMSRDLILRSLISVRCSWSLVGTASAPLGDDRAADTAAGTAVSAGQAAVRESLGLNSERPIPMGQGAKRAPWHCPGRCRALADGTVTGHEPERCGPAN